MKPITILIVGTLLFLSNFYSQKVTAQGIKFSAITEKDFAPTVYTIDSNAQAVILFDGGNAKYVSDNRSWFNIVYTYHKRVRILNKNAFDVATVEIPLFKGDRSEDEMQKLEATTYNLENGRITETKLDKASVFKDKASKNFVIEKFTFPNLKEGCIIDYTYSVISPSASHLRSWVFQDKYPVLQSNYDVTVPTLFNFIFLKGGYYNLEPTVAETGSDRFNILANGTSVNSSQLFIYNAVTVHSGWSLSNLPAMAKEPYSTTVSNYISKIDFQLKSMNYPDMPPKSVLGSWNELASTLLKDEEFGAALSLKNNWLNNDLDNLIIKGDQLTTAGNIFGFVQKNFTCTDFDAIYMTGPLKKAYQAKQGNVAEVNLVLTALLKKAGIEADPVLLSTRANGFAYEVYPLINKFNYVISKARINGNDYLLDASRKKIGFNHLPEECYNGYARIINDEPHVISLLADSLKEKKKTSIFISYDPQSKKSSGSFFSELGYYESYDLREALSKSSVDEHFKKIKSSYASYNADIKNPVIDSLNNYNEKISIGYDMDFTMDEDIIYFSPLLTEGYKTNPFSAAIRNYPVEMPYASSEVITFNMEIPDGYKIDELPKSAKISLEEGDGVFEYVIQADDKMIQLYCKIFINKATFQPEQYDSLREFFNYIVKKQGEQIVFKKKK